MERRERGKKRRKEREDDGREDHDNLSERQIINKFWQMLVRDDSAAQCDRADLEPGANNRRTFVHSAKVFLHYSHQLQYSVRYDSSLNLTATHRYSLG